MKKILLRVGGMALISSPYIAGFGVFAAFEGIGPAIVVFGLPVIVIGSMIGGFAMLYASDKVQ